MSKGKRFSVVPQLMRGGCPAEAQSAFARQRNGGHRPLLHVMVSSELLCLFCPQLAAGNIGYDGIGRGNLG